jgi:hypothetical protein
MVTFALALMACGSSSSAVGRSGDDAGDDGAVGTSGDGALGEVGLDDATSARDGATGADATSTGDGASSHDATAIDGAAAGCGEFTGDATFKCSKDGKSRGKCVAGAPVVESCARGCLRVPGGEDTCLGAAGSWPWTCTGSYGKTISTDGDYYLTSFGCWVDGAGTVHTDPGDNCIPTCLDKAIAAGLCPAGSAGPDCEEAIDWYTADGARFGCLQRLRITNPANGKSVIAVALDYGPGCSVEASVSHAALDASGRVDQYLFGGDEGITDKALVHVVEVDDATPLGPVP